MKAVVTGGAGFIGSHLCERLLAGGHDVVCLDNFHTGSADNIAHLRDHPRFSVLTHDLEAPLDLEAERIYNLACPASPAHYQRDPIKTIRTNVLGVLHVLELAERNGARVLQASTSEVYGDAQVHPQPESYWGHVNPTGPRACYDEGKRLGEALVWSYQQQRRLDVRIARIFNTYGPRMQIDDGRVVSNFIVRALRGQPLTLYGGGSQTRSFCYVDDLVGGVVALMESRVDGPVNLGNDTELTVRELAERVIRLTGSRSELADAPLPADDPRQRRPDLGRARALLGYAPTVHLDEGLGRTIEYFRKRLDRVTVAPPYSEKEDLSCSK